MLPWQKILKIANKLLLWGTCLSAAGLLCLHIFMRYIYQYETEWSYYVYGMMYTLPGYWFSPTCT